MVEVPWESGVRSFTQGRETVISYPVVSGGIRTRVVESGSGDDVLICLHGLGSRADRWVPPIPGLVENGYHVYAIDFPGHGFADKDPDLEYTGEKFAAVVASVMDELGLTRATVVGTSLGGYIAAKVANDRPQLVDSLVLIGSLGIGQYYDEYMTDPEVVSDGSPEAVRKKLGFLVSDPAQVTEAWVREESMINSSLGARESLHTLAKNINESVNDDLQAKLLRSREFTRPPLLIWGADDRWTPPVMGHDAHAALPGSTLMLMEKCGHAPYFEDPVSFVKIIKEYFHR